MPLIVPETIPAPSIAAIWAYATRTLTDPDSYKADVSALLTKAYFDTILTAARLGYIDSLATPANFMADVSALALQTSVDEVEGLLKDGTYGLSALNTDLDLLLARIGDPADPTIDATIKGYLLGLQALTETVGTTTMTGAELIVYETDRASLAGYQVPFMVEGYVDLANMAGGDTIVIREYSQAADGTYRVFASHAYTGAQTDPLIRFEMKIGGFDYKVTAEQTGGTNRVLAHLFDRRRVK